MGIVVLGVNHNTADVSVRERLHFSPSQIPTALDLLQERYPEVQEKVILSTCNRVEIYASLYDDLEGIHGLKRFFYSFHEIPEGTLENCLYLYELEKAVGHLFRVSSSLDSMLVGEPQILGQVKKAYEAARDRHATGRVLNHLFEKAFSVAKRVRTETGIAENAVSVGYAAVELARKIFGTLEGKSVMLIGAGEMIELASRNLLSSGVQSVFVSNRNFARAVELAETLGGNAIRFDNLECVLDRFDIVISSTGAPRPIVRKPIVEKAMQERRNRPMFFIDIAVPRDVDPEVNQIENVYLYDIDDLKNLTEANLREREREALKAEEIVNSEVRRFLTWLDSVEAFPTIAALRDQAEVIRKAELEKALARWKDLTDEERRSLENLTSSIVNKILHAPTVNLKRQRENTETFSYLAAIRHLFNLK
jgi:glutamyl-tRNA reductase